MDRLGELLGDEHDLAVLHTALGGSPDHPADTDTAWLLGAVTARRRVELTNEARALGPSLYAEHPDAFVDRMRGYWVTGRGPGSAAVR